MTKASYMIIKPVLIKRQIYIWCNDKVKISYKNLKSMLKRINLLIMNKGCIQNISLINNLFINLITV